MNTEINIRSFLFTILLIIVLQENKADSKLLESLAALNDKLIGAEKFLLCSISFRPFENEKNLGSFAFIFNKICHSKNKSSTSTTTEPTFTPRTLSSTTTFSPPTTTFSPTTTSSPATTSSPTTTSSSVTTASPKKTPSTKTSRATSTTEATTSIRTTSAETTTSSNTTKR